MIVVFLFLITFILTQAWYVKLFPLILVPFSVWFCRHEPKFVEEISKEIFYKLTNGPLDAGENLVGLYSRADQMNLLQLVESTKVHMIGICGIGGIGKTTIAKAVFNLLHKHFEAYSFCEDVKGVEKRHGLVRLQENLLESLMIASNLKIRSISHGIGIIKRSMSNKKVWRKLNTFSFGNTFIVFAS